MCASSPCTPLPHPRRVPGHTPPTPRLQHVCTCLPGVSIGRSRDSWDAMEGPVLSLDEEPLEEVSKVLQEHADRYRRGVHNPPADAFTSAAGLSDADLDCSCLPSME